MKAKGKLRQLKVIYRWALNVIDAYDNMKNPTDDDYKKLVDMVKGYTDASKDDEYCRKVLLDVLGAIEMEER